MERLFQLNDNTHNPDITTDILRRILQSNGIEEWAYSFDGYNDERQCMECDEDGWKVYFGERGKEKRCKLFDSQQEAGEALLRRLGQDEKQRTKMISEFNEALAALEGNSVHDIIEAICPPRRNKVYVVKLTLSGSPSLKKDSNHRKSAHVAAYKLAATDLLKTHPNLGKNTVKQNLIERNVANKKVIIHKKSSRGKMQG